MKMMLKFLGRLTLLAALALIGLAVYLKHKYPPEKIKALAIDAVKDRLGRELRLEKASLNPWRGLSLEGVALSEKPDFKAGVFLSAERVSVRPELSALLRGRLEIHRITLAAPSVAVIRFADGRFNFSDLTAPPSSSAVPGERAAPALLVESIGLRRGSATYEDRSRGLMANLRDLSVDVEEFSPAKPFPVSFSAKGEAYRDGKEIAAGTAGLTARVNLGGEGLAEIESFSLAVDGAALEAKGTIRRSADPDVDMAVTLKSVEARALAALFPLPPWANGGRVAGVVGLKGGLADSAVTGDLQASLPGITSSFDFLFRVKDPLGKLWFHAEYRPRELSVKNPPLAPLLSASGLPQGTFIVEGSSTAVHVTFSLKADDADLRWEGALSKPAGKTLTLSGEADLSAPFDDPSFKVQGRVEEMILVPGITFPKGLKASGPVSLDFTARGRLRDAAFTVDAKAKETEVSCADFFRKPAGTPLALKASVRLKDLKEVELSSATLSVAGAVVELRGGIDDPAGQGRMGLRVHAEPFDVAPPARLSSALRKYSFSGRAGIDAVLSGTYAVPRASGTLTLEGFGVVPTKGFAADRLTGAVAFTDGSIETTGLKGRFNGGDFTLTMKARNFSRLELELYGTLSSLDAGKLISILPSTGTAGFGPAFPTMTRTKGSFRIGSLVHPRFFAKDFSPAWDLTGLGPDLSRLNGDLRLTTGEGRLQGTALAKRINKVLGDDGDALAFSRLDGSFTAAQGVLDAKDFTADTNQSHIDVQGTLNLATLNSDLRVTFKLPPGKVKSSAGNLIADREGHVSVGVLIKGPLTDPTVRTDLTGAAGNAAGNLINKSMSGEESLRQRISDEGKKALDTILKKTE